jgi:ferrous-iron efflux pump FieF
MSRNHNRANPSSASVDRSLRLATWASLAVAVVLIAVKFFAYLNTGAVSIFASLLDSLIDAGASLINLLAIRYALTPPDANHRFGHGKAEPLAGLIQAAFIVTSSAVLIHEAMHRLLSPQPLTALASGVYVMLFAIVLTSMLVAFQRRVVKQTGSTAIEADSIHYRADLLSNAATLVALALASQGFTQADPLFALIIAAYLLVSTREILRRALNELLDRELPDAQRETIVAIANAQPGVLGVHGLRTRQSGRSLIVQLHIEMDGNVALRKAHATADSVEAAIHDAFPGADVTIHQEPAVSGRKPH